MFNKKTKPYLNLPLYLHLFALAFLLMLMPALGYGVAGNYLPSMTVSQAEIERQLEIEQERNRIAQQRLDRLAAQIQAQQQGIVELQVNTKLFQHAEFELLILQKQLDSVKLAFADIESELASVKEAVAGLDSIIRQLSLEITNENKVKLKQVTQQRDSWLWLENSIAQRLTWLVEYQNIIERHSRLQVRMIEYMRALILTNAQQQYSPMLSTIRQEQSARQQQLLVKLTDLNTELEYMTAGSSAEVNAKTELELTLFELSERDYLIHHAQRINTLDTQIQQLLSQQFKLDSAVAYVEFNRQVRIIHNELTQLRGSLSDNIIRFVQQKAELADKNAEGILDADMMKSLSNVLQVLIDDYYSLRSILDEQQIILDDYQQRLVQTRSESIDVYQKIVNLGFETWYLLGTELLATPSHMLQYADRLQKKLVEEVEKASLQRLSALLLITLFFVILYQRGRYYLQKILGHLQQKDQRLIDNTLLIILTVVHRRLFSIILLTWFIIGYLAFDMPLSQYGLPAYLLMIWLLFNICINVAKITLLESSADDSAGRDVRLYRTLRWILIVSGLVTTLVVLAWQFLLHYALLDLFIRLLMLILLGAGIVLLKWWREIPNIFSGYLEGQPVYVKHIVAILSLALPAIIFANALIGLLGFVELLWTLLIAQGIFLLLLIGYITSRGLLSGLIDKISDALIRQFRNGWLWTRIILKPVDRILQIGLLLLAAYLLFLAYGWDQDSAVVTALINILYWPFIEVGETKITLSRVITFIVSIYVLIWAAKWSRELAYRWLYVNTRDIGLRNSFAVFTQYAIVTVGIFIILRILGIDFTSLTVIAGAMMLAVGFGLRDLANNFVSGVFLLVERPVRKGDFVTVDQHDGEVVHIGMRSVTVKTWDNIELMVPNSDIFSKVFTNWTRHDTIVRTVVSVKINPVDDPHMVQALIFNVLTKEVDVVVDEPEPRVFLKRIDESLIEFSVMYFINLQQERSRAKARSEVLFKIWDSFKKQGIKPPFPQQDIHISPSQ